VLIGSSFVFKKKGLLSAQKKYQTTAGEGYSYLKSPLWWTGMMIMIIGEVFNFVAYAFAPAVLVTPFGALSVVLCAILSSIFLKERLTLFGKVGCFLCVIGSVIIALNGPSDESSGSIVEFRKLFLSVGFLIWLGICVVASLVLIFWAAPRYGKKNMMVYVIICSLLGGLSVSTTSGLGSAILLSIRGDMQLKNWFFYVLLAFVIVTLLSEIVFLNKALELFNTSMVTPAYFVTFTSCSIISTIILYKGLAASPASIVTLVLGFFVICTGIVLLQLSKIDPEELTKEETPPGLDRRSTLLMRASRSMISTRSEKQDTELGYQSSAVEDHGAHLAGRGSTAIEDPGIDTMRGVGGIIGSIVRARSSRRVRASADSYANLGGAGSRNEHHSMASLNTAHRHDLERFQLQDGPVARQPSTISRDGYLSPISAAFPQNRGSAMPKRGASMVSFTEDALGPHGHHDQHQHSEHQHHHPPTASHSGILSTGLHAPYLSDIVEVRSPRDDALDEANARSIGRGSVWKDSYIEAYATMPNRPGSFATTAPGTPQPDAAEQRSGHNYDGSGDSTFEYELDDSTSADRGLQGPYRVESAVGSGEDLPSIDTNDLTDPAPSSTITRPRTDKHFPGGRGRREDGLEEEELLSPKLDGEAFEAPKTSCRRAISSKFHKSTGI
jgi:drug/metabolite transporter (DMT)-like permease